MAALTSTVSFQGLSASKALRGSNPLPQSKAPLRAFKRVGAVAKHDYAIVELGSRQFKMAEDDVIYADKLSGVEVGDVVDLGRVLLLKSDGDKLNVGRPYLEGAKVTVQMIRTARAEKKVDIARKPLSVLKVLEVHGPAGKPIKK
eukprot:jgi/Mesvir1/14907/Mv05505-RA.1